MRRFAPPAPRRTSSSIRLASGIVVATVLALATASAQQQALPVPMPGRNVNMVSGTNFPDGDPFLQRQNEPSIAVSTRNPLHLLGAANDYRTVDIPGLGDEVNGDAWLGVFKSFDGGTTWKSTLLPGFRQDATAEGRTSPLFGLQAAADPVMRAGTNGLFYLGGMAFNRDQDSGKVFVARYIDDNNKEKGDTIRYLGTSIVDVGSETRFLDKPWIAVDIPRAMKGRGRSDDDDRNERGRYRDKRSQGWDKDRDRRSPAHPNQSHKPPAGPTCEVPGQSGRVPAGTIYVMYSAFIDPPAGFTREDEENERRGGRDRDQDRRERDADPDGGFERRFRRERENSEDHKPGTPMEGRTLIMLSRSTDCGVTFTRPVKISERTQINQGSTAAIDPNTGDLYVAWREFRSNKQPDAILAVRSTDGGASFSDPVTVALINPFDQATTTTSFRTNSYPTMAADGSGRIYIAWAQRGIGPSGDARIVVSSSTDGRRWSAPAAADNHSGRGHQIMPVLSFGGGKLNLVFWDQRDDVSKKWGPFIDDLQVLTDPVPPGQTRKRHTLDLRAVAGWPGAPATWGPSAKLSNYLEGVRPGKTALDEQGKPISEQLQYNAPNLPLFSLGTKPFIGDYLDVTVSPSFIANGDGTWRFNTEKSDPSIYFTAFSDNRDVRPPTDPLGDLNHNGNFWDDYTPPTFAGWTGTSIFDPTQSVEMCSPGRAGMRDQNIYSNKVQSGLVLSTLGNSKPLGYVTDANGVRRLIQRTFVVTASNPDPVTKSVVLHINSQPPGGHASWLQFDQLIDLPVKIAPKSSISRQVFVTSTDPKASVPVTVTEGTSTTAAGRVVINADPTNPDIENPDIENPDIENPDIENAEAHNITVSNPTVSNPDIENLTKANPDIENPDIENPDIENRTVSNLSVLNPDIENPDIENPDIENPDIENPDIENPDIENPDIENPDIENAALTDIKWNVENVGNTATVYQVKLLLKQAQQQRLMQSGVKFQLLVIKKTAAPVIGSDKCKVVEPDQNLTVVNIFRPAFVDPANNVQFSTVVNPDIENPDIENATVALAPGDIADVVLRVYSPIGDTTLDPNVVPGDENALADLAGSLQDLEQVGVATTSHPVDTAVVNSGGTTPVVQASIPIIVTTTLDDATRTVAYTQTLEQTGATGDFGYVVVSGSLPPGLTLDPNGTISGTPTATGTFPFTVRLTDENEMTASASLTIRVFEPIGAVASPLTGALVNQAYSTTLSAIGGFPPYGWTLTGGSLPAGVTLSPLGVLSGTPTQSGAFTFTATVTDAALPARSATGAFVLNVTGSASGQSVSVVEDTATPITLSGSGGGPFTFNIGNQPAHGTLTGVGPTFTYTPDLNYNGPDSFTFSVTQGALTSAFATVSINVTAVNDAPVAASKTVNTPAGQPILISLTGTDAENSALTFSIVTNPASGSLSGSGASRTYTPAGGFQGTATFTYRANDGAQFGPNATVTILVGPPPAGYADVSASLSDAPDPQALGGTVTYTATIQNNAVGAPATGVTWSMSYPGGDLRLISAAPAQGTCNTANPIVCSIGNLANGATVTIPVVLKAVSRAGTFTVSSSLSATQPDYDTSNNAAAQSTVITGSATPSTDLSVSQSRLPATVAVGNNVVYTIVVTNNGPSDATGVSLTSTFSSNTALFVSSSTTQGACSSGPSALTCALGDLFSGASATITLTLKASASGSISNTSTVSGSQADPASANNSQALSTPIDNRPPTANDDAVTTTEDNSQTFAVRANDVDLDGDALTITGVTAPAIGTAQIIGNAILYTPAPNEFGTTQFDYTIDDGRGGTDTGTVTVTIVAVNDAPSFTKGADITAPENGGAQVIPAWANPATFSKGPANESGQNLQFLLTSNAPMFSVPPAVSSTGTLTFTPATDAQGTATITIYALDNGGTTNGGIDTSAAQTFTITLTPVNSAPSFVKGANQTVPEDSPLQTVPNWATFIKAGPPDESGQAVNFIVSTNNDDLFETLPAISPTGTLTYKPAPDANGSAQVFVSLHDNGGAPPGIDTSEPQSFYIAVTAQVDPLVAVNDTAVAPPATAININVVGNDTGPTATAPGRLVTFERFAAATIPFNMGSVNETARVPSTGYIYAAGGRGIAVLNPTTNSVVTTIDTLSLGLAGANYHVVNATSSILYLRIGTTVVAIDGRAASATFNQVVGRLQLGSSIQAFAVDETRNLLYISYISSTAESIFQARLAIVDANPASATFHQIVGELIMPQNVRGIAVDAAADKVYLASDAGFIRIDNASQPTRTQAVVAAGGSLQEIVIGAKIYAYGFGGRIAALDPTTQTATSFTIPTLTTGFNAGRRMVLHAATNRLFIRSAGTAGSPGKVVVIDGNTATWPNSAVLADIAIGRDGASDIVVDQGRGLVIASSAIDYRLSFIDATATPPALSGTELSLANTGDIGLDPVVGRIYVGAAGMLNRVSLSPRTVMSPLHFGGENGFTVALPGPGGTNVNRFYVGRTGLGTAVRQYKINGTPSTANLPHSAGRITFLAANQATNRLYFLNGAADSTGTASTPASLTVVNGATGALIANVDVLNSAFGLAVNEVTNKIYTGGATTGIFPSGISVIDGVSHTVSSVNVSAFPVNTQFNRYLTPLCVGASCAAINKVYIQAITPADGTTVAVVDGATNVATPISPAIGATAVNLIKTSNAFSRVFIGNQLDANSPNDVFVVNGATDAKITTLVGVTSQTNALVTQSYLAVDESRGRVYLTDFNNDRLTILNALSEAGCNAAVPAPSATCYPVIATIATGDGPSSVAIDVAANRVYVANTNDRSITFIDGATFKVLGRLSVPLQPTQMSLDTSSPAITYIAVAGSNNDPGFMLVTDTRGGGGLSVAPGTLTQAANGATSVNADGTVQYNPQPAFVGNDTFTYRVTDGVNVSPSAATVTVQVKPPLSITTTTLAEGTVGSAYSQSLVVTGGTPPYFLNLSGGLPMGILVNYATATISGTPATSGNFSLTLTARDSAVPQTVVQRNYTLSVGPFEITTTGLTTATLNQPYSATLLAGGSPNKPYTWSLAAGSNPLPPGISLSSAGVLSGTPTQVNCNSTSFTVQATDASLPIARTATRTLTMGFTAPQTILTGSLFGTSVLESLPSLNAMCGSGTRTWTLDSGVLPAGVTLNSNGSFTGLARGTGDFPLVIRATDLTGSITKNVTMRVMARDQQGSSSNLAAITFGGSKQIAQTFTVASHGAIAGLGLTNITCPSSTALTLGLQRLTIEGLPDGTTIAAGTAPNGYGSVAISPTVPAAIGDRFALVVSSPVNCTLNNPSSSDQYNGGDAYVNNGGGWSAANSLLALEGRYDVPSFRSLITPAKTPAYMTLGRNGFTGTLLPNGSVLLAGQSNSTSAELYDPATNAITTIANPMTVSRVNLTATLLGNGKVLLAGGRDGSGNRLASAELYDPGSNTFTATPAMSIARENHRAALLNDGRVLITGGTGTTGNTLNSAEIYDPAAGANGTFTLLGGTMSTGRVAHTATTLADGRVLIAGGYTTGSGSSAELFNPATSQFTATTGSMQIGGRGYSTATLLPNGKVLIAGGQSGDVRSEAELFDPNTNTFAATGALGGKRFVHTATLLQDGTVLIAGGYDQAQQTGFILGIATLERYDPNTGQFAPAGGLQTRRVNHVAVRLNNDPVNKHVFIVGGSGQSWMSSNSGELFKPEAALTLSPLTVPAAATSGAYAGTTFTASGGVAPYTIEVVSGALPANISYDQPTATLSGANGARAAGAYQLGFKVTDAALNSSYESRTLIVGTVNSITTPYGAHDAYLNVGYSLQLNATSASTWSLAPGSGSLPPGLNIGSGGLISGTPTSTGFYNVTVRAVSPDGTAVKVIAINVTNAMVITTTSLGQAELFNSGFSGNNCVSISNGNGTRTWSIIAGSLPQGATLNSTSGCFGGMFTRTGAFSFTVDVVDTSNPPQHATRQYTGGVWARDQNSSDNGAAPALFFGNGTGNRLAQRVYTGITGTLRAVRITNVSCTVSGTTLSVDIQGLDPAGMPDGHSLASGSVAYPSNTISLNTGVFMAADVPFTIVFDAGASCSVKPPTFDQYPGDGFISVGGGSWQRLQASPDGRFDIPFVSLIDTVAGLIPMTVSRGSHSETVLPSGKVLIAGGNGSQSSAEVYDPATNTSQATTGAMIVSRQGHTATLINGKVLIAGGRDSFGTRLSSTEIYDPVADTFAAGPPMNVAREQHAATLLPDNTILITGGTGTSGNSLNSAEIYNPAAGGSFSSTTGNMVSTRSNHTSTMLGNGRVLIAGGYGCCTNGEVYEYGTQTFTATTNAMSTFRSRHVAVMLDNGKVLLAGGTGNAGEAVSSAELFTPSVNNGSFSSAGNMLLPRVDPAAVKLADGSVLIGGGYADNTCCFPHQPNATMERYVTGTGFVGASAMSVARYEHSATMLGNGKVLITGTYGWSSAAGRLAELYDPAASPYLQTTEFSAPSGAPMAFTLVPAGGSGSGHVMTMMSGTLPTGVNLNLSLPNNHFSGTPSQSGTFVLTIKVEDGAGHISYQPFTLRIDPVTVTTTSLPTAYTGVTYSGQLAGSGLPPLTWSIISGALPSGLTLNASTGEITGSTNQTCCSFSFTVRLTDSLGQTTIRTLPINVQQPLTINTTSLVDNFAGFTYGGGVNASWGTSPYTWSMSGGPVGLQLNPATGSFLTSYPADIIRESGTFTLHVQVSDSGAPPQNASRNIPLNIYAQDQSIGSLLGPDTVFQSTRRLAQVLVSGTSFDLRGVQPWSLYCDPNVTLTARVYPVTGGLAPDESGAPLAIGSLTTNAFGFFPSNTLTFSSPLPMARGTAFAVVFSGSGQCKVQNWSNFDYYSRGDAWVSDNNGAWTLADTVIAGKRDLPLSTVVIAPSPVRFLVGYKGSHATAQLNDGRVLLVGQEHYTEVYDPATHSLTVTANMSHAREFATATVLPNGKVLIAGGAYWDTNTNSYHASTTTQIFNPATGQLEASQNMSTPRSRHTATLLGNGNVLITGGQDLVNSSWAVSQTADIFDGSGNLISTINMTEPRVDHTATLLNNGKVLLVGGWGGGTYVAELYDPIGGTFTGVSSAITWPIYHTATLVTTGPHAGQVLITGGSSSTNYPNLSPNSYFFEPITNVFLSAPSLLTNRLDHTATVLPNGRIVFAGGVTIAGDWSQGTSSIETYDPVTDDRVLLGNMITDRLEQQVNLVTTPNGPRLAVSGGFGSSALVGRTLELFDPTAALGSFAAATPMTQARRSHVAVELNNGTVLLAGSDNNSGTTEIYTPATNSTTAGDPMIANRCYGCAYVKLQSGKVLIAGGWTTSGPVLNTAEIFDPANGQFHSTAGNMVANRLGANAILLNNGKVLILGGHNGFSGYSSAELFDPVTETFTATGSLSTVRLGPAAIKLQDGRVLVAGGVNGSTYLNTAEIYDPSTGQFTGTGTMVNGRQAEQPVLLNDGRVLIVGGWNGAVMNHPEVYNPGNGTFTSVGSMTTERSGHFVVKLASGAVVVGAGLNGANQSLNSAEMFNPLTNTFTRIANLPSARVDAKAILLSDGRIMISGGTSSGNNRVATVEYYTP